jgi:quercetin 2,3-dioxygenase
MIWLRRANERRHDRRRGQEVWSTFYPLSQGHHLAEGFGALSALNEVRLPPGGRTSSFDAAEILTYVHEGALTYQDSTGHSGVLHAGEFQHLLTARRVRHDAANASRTESAHIFQLCLKPSGIAHNPLCEQKRFSAAERRGELRLIASPDAQDGSLRTHQDARLYSALLAPGQHVVHELAQKRSAWLHIVQGEVTLGDVVLNIGDAAGLVGERVASLTAREVTEVLLLEVGEQTAITQQPAWP